MTCYSWCFLLYLPATSLSHSLLRPWSSRPLNCSTVNTWKWRELLTVENECVVYWIGALNSCILRAENFASILLVQNLPCFEYITSIDGNCGGSKKAVRRSRRPGHGRGSLPILPWQFSLFVFKMVLQIKDDYSSRNQKAVWLNE